MVKLYAMSSEKTDTRSKILNAAWHLLEDRDLRGGRGAVRMSDIAKQAGVSRQAVYLHFPNRAELLIATTRHLDEAFAIDQRLAESRSARTGRARLVAFITAWANYIPEIFGVARALMEMQTTDEEAARAWEDRMQALRHGCAAAVDALAVDGDLAADIDAGEATDQLWALLSVPTWMHLRHQCGWSQERYLAQTIRLAERLLLP